MQERVICMEKEVLVLVNKIWIYHYELESKKKTVQRVETYWPY